MAIIQVQNVSVRIMRLLNTGEVILLRLYPESDEIKTLVRKELSTMTVYLEYTDIYNAKFQDKRLLDFFGRHYL